MTMTAEQSRQTGGYYANQWTVRDEYAAAAIAGANGNSAMNVPSSTLAKTPVHGQTHAAERRRGTQRSWLPHRRRDAGRTPAGLW